MKKHSLFFWDLMAKRYSRSPVDDEEAYQKKLEKTQEYFRPDMEVMEFGCGTGSTAITHAPHVKHILATDGSANMIEIAKGKAEAQGIENVTFELATIDEFTAPDNSYDVVMGMSILHLLKNKEAAIEMVYKMLKPGGFFVSSTVCMSDMSPIAKYIAPIGRIVGLVLDTFTAEELKESMEVAGFQIDHEWRPGKDKAVFIIAKKPE